MASTVQVRGAQTLRATLRRAQAALADQTPANAKVADMVRLTASRTAPRRSGRLAGGHRATRTKVEAGVTNAVQYAGPIHFGVGPRRGLRGPHNIRPRPWLANAVTGQRDALVGVYADRMHTIVSKIRGTSS